MRLANYEVYLESDPPSNATYVLCRLEQWTS